MKTDSPAHVVARFAAVVAATLATLVALNLLPQVLGGEPTSVVRYDTPAQVEARYGVRVWQPAALPGAYRDATVRVRVAPGAPAWLQLAFAGARARALVVCQTLEASPDGEEVHPALLPAADLLQVSAVTVDGRKARLRRLLLADGAIVHELWWREDRRNVMLRLRAPVDELLALAHVALGTTR